MRRTFDASLAVLLIAACGACLPRVAGAQSDPALQPQTRSAQDIFTEIDAARLGLRPPSAALRERVAPSYGLNYHRESKSLLMPLDQKNEWSMGLNLNLNAGSTGVETAPDQGLNLQPRRTPGLIFNKKF